jgi:hypothetical protein
MKKTKNILFGILLITLLIGSITTRLAAQEEGGYAGNDSTAPNVVYNFLRHFDHEQFYWAIKAQFTSNNNNRVDAMDFAYYCGHGAPWKIGYYLNGSGSGASGTINLTTAGSSSHRGYGDTDLEFIVFHSCQVIPSPLEYNDWYSNWVSESDDIFDGMHMALGFRTSTLISTAPGIADYFGRRMADRGRYVVLDTWFDAINAEGNHSGGYDYGCAVMYPGADDDIYQGTVIADPPETHTNLRVWYQH